MPRATKRTKKTTKQSSNKTLKAPAGWSFTPKGTVLKRSFLFKDYLTAFLFVARVSVHSEVLKHHPDIKLSYGKVDISLTTHSATAVTKKDIELAERINQFADVEKPAVD